MKCFYQNNGAEKHVYAHFRQSGCYFTLQELQILEILSHSFVYWIELYPRLFLRLLFHETFIWFLHLKQHTLRILIQRTFQIRLNAPPQFFRFNHIGLWSQSQNPLFDFIQAGHPKNNLYGAVQVFLDHLAFVPYFFADISCQGRADHDSDGVPHHLKILSLLPIKRVGAFRK